MHMKAFEHVNMNNLPTNSCIEISLRWLILTSQGLASEVVLERDVVEQVVTVLRHHQRHLLSVDVS